jgi:hypothetical protein
MARCTDRGCDGGAVSETFPQSKASGSDPDAGIAVVNALVVVSP